MNEFTVNEYLSLKLEDGKTYIYIKGERFIQCARLVLNIPKSNLKKFRAVNSIDEAEIVSKTLYEGKIMESDEEHSITPEQEYWGHCSNLQAWVENTYDTRLLHSNLAFPLLKRLVELGDPIAVKSFKEEIALRLESGFDSVVTFLFIEGYLSFLDEQEIYSILDTSKDKMTRLILESHLNHQKIDIKEYWYELAIKELGEGTIENAIRAFNVALDIDPMFSKAWLGLGNVYYSQREYDKALEAYTEGTGEMNMEDFKLSFPLEILVRLRKAGDKIKIEYLEENYKDNEEIFTQVVSILEIKGLVVIEQSEFISITSQGLNVVEGFVKYLNGNLE